MEEEGKLNFVKKQTMKRENGCVKMMKKIVDFFFDREKHHGMDSKFRYYGSQKVMRKVDLFSKY